MDSFSLYFEETNMSDEMAVYWLDQLRYGIPLTTNENRNKFDACTHAIWILTERMNKHSNVKKEAD